MCSWQLLHTNSRHIRLQCYAYAHHHIRSQSSIVYSAYIYIAAMQATNFMDEFTQQHASAAPLAAAATASARRY